MCPVGFLHVFADSAAAVAGFSRLPPKWDPVAMLRAFCRHARQSAVSSDTAKTGKRGGGGGFHAVVADRNHPLRTLF